MRRTPASRRRRSWTTPPSNDPGCSAGFAHGLVTGGADTILGGRSRRRRVCAKAGNALPALQLHPRVRAAFMRINADRLAPALDLCRALGAAAAADCAQGAYHDYWFAAVGADYASLPAQAVTKTRAALCGAQPRAFVAACWYRAFVDNRPAGQSDPSTISTRSAKVKGVNVRRANLGLRDRAAFDQADQLQLCAGLGDTTDAQTCVRGIKVQNLSSRSTATYVQLIGRCELFAGATRCGVLPLARQGLAVHGRRSLGTAVLS